ncbi:uncharacterized protein LOC123550133 [Mercenaria mercenaria]|uniref:uncharacterized protein LOC123550133 n=1 Tax=Mercenaria mercenaria TaxID=6596 RepID=UPI00234EB340|nr:uncharacterized protein LOC123550133 [Mercenaria mercenaria]
MLRAYRTHPTRWNDVIDDIKQNIDRLPQPVREFYNSATIKQLKDRLSVKLAKLMSTRNIEDQDLRGEVESIRENERRLVRNAPRAGEPMQQNGRQQAPAADQENNADHGDRDRQVDGDQAAPAGRAERRDAAAAALSDNHSEGDEPEPPRRRLAELIMCLAPVQSTKRETLERTVEDILFRHIIEFSTICWATLVGEIDQTTDAIGSV